MPDYVVEVNECRVFATTQGAEWWSEFRRRCEPSGRLKIMTATLGGDVVEVACDSRDDADWLRQHMIASGMPSKAVTVRRARAVASA